MKVVAVFEVTRSVLPPAAMVLPTCSLTVMARRVSVRVVFVVDTAPSAVPLSAVHSPPGLVSPTNTAPMGSKSVTTTPVAASLEPLEAL